MQLSLAVVSLAGYFPLFNGAVYESQCYLKDTKIISVKYKDSVVVNLPRPYISYSKLNISSKAVQFLQVCACPLDWQTVKSPSNFLTF